MLKDLLWGRPNAVAGRMELCNLVDDKLWRLDVGQRIVVVGAIKFGMAHFSGSAFGGSFLPSVTFDPVPNTYVKKIGVFSKVTFSLIVK